jgi:hypothetical protein
MVSDACKWKAIRRMVNNQSALKRGTCRDVARNSGVFGAAVP